MENKLHFDEMMMIIISVIVLELSWIFIVLAHWNNSPRVDMPLHSDTLFRFPIKDSLSLLFSAACIGERQHILIYCLWFDMTAAQTHDLPQ